MPVQRQFYREIQKWINDGMKDHPIFYKDVGICSIYREWIYYTNSEMRSIKTDFKAAGLHSCYPFNENLPDYIKEQMADSIYMNPRRLAWIKEHANPRPRTNKQGR